MNKLDLNEIYSKPKKTDWNNILNWCGVVFISLMLILAIVYG